MRERDHPRILDLGHSSGPGPGLSRMAGPVLVGVAVVAAVLLLLSGSPASRLTAIVAFLAICCVTGVAMQRHYPHRQFGACNLVTLLRAALLSALLAPLLAGSPAGWSVAIVATIAVTLDGVDGWLARRSGLQSRFGARFDVEVDAALALVLSLHVLTGTAVGAEILVLGLMRYAFVAAGLGLSWLRADLPPSQRRKVICVLQLSALILLQTPLPDGNQAIIIARIASAILIWSFAVDIHHLWKHRG